MGNKDSKTTPSQPKFLETGAIVRFIHKITLQTFEFNVLFMDLKNTAISKSERIRKYLQKIDEELRLQIKGEIRPRK